MSSKEHISYSQIAVGSCPYRYKKFYIEKAYSAKILIDALTINPEQYII